MKPANRQRKPVRLALIAAAVAAACSTTSLHAADATWLGGTGNWNVGGNWSPAGVPNSALTNVFIDGGNALNSIVTLNIGATIGNLAIGAGDSLGIANGQGLRLGGLLSSDGGLTLAGNNFLTDLSFGSDTSLTGSGSISLSNSSINRIYGATGAERLTIGVGQSIVGSGQIGVGQLRVTNLGTIAASGSAGLSFLVSSTAGTFNNAGGVIEVRDGSLANFGSGQFEGGTLRGQTTGVLTGSVNATLGGVNIEGVLGLRNGEGLGIAGVSVNTGTLRLDGNNFHTDLRINGDASVNGAGTILLSNSGNNRIYGQVGSNTLTLGVGQTLRGAGQLGVNQLNIVNQGAVVAEGSAGLNLHVGTFNNAGGAIEVRDGSFARFTGGTFSGGVLRGALTGELAGSTNATLNGVNIEGVLGLRNGEGVGIAGVSVNSGTLKLNGNNFLTDLRINGDATLNGVGTILLSNSGVNRIFSQSGSGTLTLGAGQTLRGAGQLGVGLLNVANQGTVVAEGSVGLDIRVGTFNNAGGAIEVRDGSFARFGSGTFSGGVLRGALTGEVAGSTNATLNGVNIEGVLGLRNGEGVGIAGVSVNSGMLKLNGNNFLTDLRINGDATVNGVGTILLSNSGVNRIFSQSGSGTLTLGAGQTLRGAGQLGVGLLNIANQGTVVAEGSVGLDIRVGTFNNAGGAIEVRDGSFARFTGGTFSGGVLRGALTGELAGSTNATLDGVNIEGVLGLRNGEGVGIAGVSVNSGTLKLNGNNFLTDLRLNGDATINGSGTILLSNSGVNRIYGDSNAYRLTIGAGQTLRGAGQLGVNQLQITNNGSIVADQAVALTVNPTAADPLTNRGTVEVASGSQMTLSGSNLLQDGAAARTVVNGTLTTALVELDAGSLSGTGTVIGAVSNSGGSVAPGASPGKLTIQGNYTQGGAGSFDVEISGLQQGVEHDWLAITGIASLAGSLRLNFGYTPTLGSTFVILTSGGLRTGTFSTLIQPSGWDVVATYNPHDVTLTVAAVPEPETYALMFAGLALVGFAARRRRLEQTLNKSLDFRLSNRSSFQFNRLQERFSQPTDLFSVSLNSAPQIG